MITPILILAASLTSPTILAPNISFSENLQIRQATQYEETLNGSSTTSQTQHKGRYSLSVETDGDFSKLASDTGIAVKFGNFLYVGKIGDDPSFKSDRRSASLNIYADPKATVKFVTGQVQLKWSPTHISLKLTGRVPESPSPVAADIPNGGSEKFIGQTEVTAQIGSTDIRRKLEFAGKFRRKEMARGNVTGSETNIDLNGKI